MTTKQQKVVELENVVVRFAGDSGDGMQLTGALFSDAAAIAGNDFATFPDYPAEIRAPQGTVSGVSGFQIHFGHKEIYTSGDLADVLVAMNPAPLKKNLMWVKKGGTIIVDTDTFTDKALEKAGYAKNPLSDGSLNDYQLINAPITELTKKSVEDLGLDNKMILKSRNMFALGIMFYIFNRKFVAADEFFEKKFKANPLVIESNKKILRAGFNYAETIEALSRITYTVEPAALAKGKYRNITGNQAVALGLVVASRKADLPLFLGSYPITPATEILQAISGYKKYGVRHLQAEDEIAGITSAIGAAFGGSLAATTTSGPGLSLKTEAIGLAVMTELPLIIIDVQRAGPSTGLPTKPEQSDLLQAMYGRHGEAPLPVLAASSASNCFSMTLEAARIALKYMTPVILLTDGYIGQATEPWRIPSMSELPDLKPNFVRDLENYGPYRRDPETLSRMWAIPGIQGLEHRIGGLEKQDITGQVSHDPMNHQKMVEFRKEKIERIAKDIPKAEVHGEKQGDLLILSWGSTYGAAKTAYDKLTAEGKNISFVHLKYIHPFPENLGEILYNFKRILIPEMNMGQLKIIIQSKYLVPVIGFNKVMGIPFKAAEIEDKIVELLNHKD